MKTQQQTLRRFGVDDRLSCPKCSNLMSLTRRPDPGYNLRYERQIFTCPTCGGWIERIVDSKGYPPTNAPMSD